MIEDLFQDQTPALPAQQKLGPGAWLLRSMISDSAARLFAEINEVTRAHPFRQMVTQGGHSLSVHTSSCGAQGWVSDVSQGYRYTSLDPLSNTPWPAIPEHWRGLAQQLALQAGYPDFVPDTVLINRYAPGTQMGLHQDRDEATLAWPIVSLSLGLSARFMWGGLARRDPVVDVPLLHGDAVVWGGPDRLRYHGVRPLKEGYHSLTKRYRYNLTFRRVVA